LSTRQIACSIPGFFPYCTLQFCSVDLFNVNHINVWLDVPSKDLSAKGFLRSQNNGIDES
jgi:hypothetical protein